MDILKNLLTKNKKRNKLISLILDPFQDTKDPSPIIRNGDFEASYLHFSSFDAKIKDIQVKIDILFYHNVGRNKKYLVADFIQSQLREGIDLIVIASYVENRFDFRLFYSDISCENKISIYLKTIF